MRSIPGIIICLLITPTPGRANFSNWVGSWSGRCVFNDYNSERMTADTDMRLRIHPLDGSYEWTIQYGDERARNYVLENSDSGLFGHYILDEKNGILIDRFFSNGVLLDLYSVSGKVFTSRTIVENGLMKIETTSFWSTPIRDSSLDDMESSVLSFALRNTIYCELNKSGD